MNINRLSQVFCRHDRAFNMPPGRPLPQGESQEISSSLALFQRAKSMGLLLIVVQRQFVDLPHF